MFFLLLFINHLILYYYLICIFKMLLQMELVIGFTCVIWNKCFDSNTQISVFKCCPVTNLYTH